MYTRTYTRRTTMLETENKIESRIHRTRELARGRVTKLGRQVRTGGGEIKNGGIGHRIEIIAYSPTIVAGAGGGL